MVQLFFNRASDQPMIFTFNGSDVLSDFGVIDKLKRFFLSHDF